MDLKKLQDKMPYKTRVGPGGKQLAYITARQAQDRLDEVCGPENWSIEYKEIAGNLFAGVSIKVENAWITKWDAGSESNIEKEKGHISDSFKRACVTWGIGRFLYGDLGDTKPIITTPKKKAGSSLDDICNDCGMQATKIKTGTTKTGKPYHLANCQCGESFFIKPDFFLEKGISIDNPPF